MPEQHVQIMKGLGLSDADIQAVEALTPEQLKAWKADDPEQLKVFDPAKIIGTVQSGIKNQLSNDPEFLNSIPEDKVPEGTRKKIESGQYARFQNELWDVATKKLGIDGEKDLTPDDKKSISNLMQKVATVYLNKNNKVEGLQDMQKKLQDALQLVEASETKHGETLKTELEKVNGKYSAKIIKTLTKVELAGLENVKLGIAAGFIADPALAALSAKYTVVLGDDDSLSLKQKDNPKLDAIDSKGKTITFAQALRDVVLEQKLGVEVKDDPNDPTKKKKIIVGPDNDGGGGGGGESIPSYIADKINANGDLK